MYTDKSICLIQLAVHYDNPRKTDLSNFYLHHCDWWSANMGSEVHSSSAIFQMYMSWVLSGLLCICVGEMGCQPFQLLYFIKCPIFLKYESLSLINIACMLMRVEPSSGV